jgi:hypothetical protein
MRNMVVVFVTAESIDRYAFMQSLSLFTVGQQSDVEEKMSLAIN